MDIHARRYNTRILVAIAVMVASFALFTPKPAFAGLADNVYGWLWSGTIGWISLNCTNTATCATIDYGVTLTDTAGFFGWADMTGWAWSETMGWVCFGTTCGGTTPEGGASYAQFRDDFGGKQDQLWGWAKIDSLGDDGWISLNCENLAECASSNYHVSLDTTNGVFDKGAFNDNWAWGMTDADTGAGWVDSSYAETRWTVSSLGIVLRPEGVYEPDNPGLVGTHLTAFRIGFDHLFAPKDALLECDISVPDASTRKLSKVMPDVVRDDYDYLEYVMQPADFVDPDQLWFIDGCRIGSILTADACVTDADCAAQRFCDEAAGFCRLTLREKIRKWPIFTHSNNWSGLDLGDDQYKALRCNSGFPASYFNNAAWCDFTGDASFSLVMRRGVPIEGDCHDGIDNDGNGQIDCADRYCQGISYRCQTRPRTECVWGMGGDGIADCSEVTYELGDLCCTRQPVSESSGIFHIVNGAECAYGDDHDGYYDCDCTSAAEFDVSEIDDCFAPGYQAGDLCCDANDDVTKL
ncbi:MAG: hypothetical protein U9Q03_05040 [Patescibacteria group bacterium]|nr:hypothetical protein [Patescibacteria group bacterium]